MTASLIIKLNESLEAMITPKRYFSFKSLFDPFLGDSRDRGQPRSGYRGGSGGGDGPRRWPGSGGPGGPSPGKD